MDSETRQEMVRAAISFLQNPKLGGNTLKDKLEFLKNKGLTEVEVDEALNMALINRHKSTDGRWNFLLIFGLCIGGYRLYQAYKKDVPPPIEKKDLKKEKLPEVTTLNESAVVDILTKLGDLKRLLEAQKSSINKDIQSLKTLLVGHERFASPPVIPAWQLDKDKSEKESHVTDPSRVDHSNVSHV